MIESFHTFTFITLPSYTFIMRELPPTLQRLYDSSKTSSSITKEVQVTIYLFPTMQHPCGILQYCVVVWRLAVHRHSMLRLCFVALQLFALWNVVTCSVADVSYDMQYR